MRGPSHVCSATPNQDSWLLFESSRAIGVAVSDGVGSKRFADLGSAAASRAVRLAVREASSEVQSSKLERLPERIHAYWLSRIRPFEVRDCAATCLYACVSSDGNLHVGLIGDGSIGVLKNDGEVEVLEADKESSFSNMTISLGVDKAFNSWRTAEFAESECQAVLLCTDGVCDDLEDFQGFVRDFVFSHSSKSVGAASRSARRMLEEWPVPGHSDDKTIACLYRVLDNG